MRLPPGPKHPQPTSSANGEPVGETESYACQVVTDEALAWIEQHVDSNEPFFAFVSFHEPHEPVASPPDLVESYAGPVTRTRPSTSRT